MKPDAPWWLIAGWNMGLGTADAYLAYQVAQDIGRHVDYRQVMQQLLVARALDRRRNGEPVPRRHGYGAQKEHT